MIFLKRTNSTDQDFKYLTSILDKELTDYYGEEQKTYDQYNIVEDNQTVVIAYNNNSAVGCGCIKKYSDDTVEIKRMFVRKDYRGQGISKLILRELENWSIEKRFKKAILETGIYQKNAIGLYSKCGYKKIDNYGQYINIETSICMIKNLIDYTNG